MVLDDPFSAVDFQTARAIFANLFAKETGILRQINSTIIMATQTGNATFYYWNEEKKMSCLMR